MTTSVGSKQKLIENSFDICTTKFKLDIFAFLFSWPVNPIDFDTLLMRGILYLFSSNISVYYVLYSRKNLLMFA